MAVYPEHGHGHSTPATHSPPSMASTSTDDLDAKSIQQTTKRADTDLSDLSDPTRFRQTEKQLVYRNSLLAMVGWLDLTNSLDFPANVWNDYPVPLYALVLMGIGGSIALIASTWGIWDAFRCWKNIQFLRAERKALHYEQKKYPHAGNARLRRAWLGVNFRELGWECIDRLFLDFIMVFSGLFVGAGTLMALKGEIPEIFMASNLMSGYVGNAWLPFYAICNSIWSAYMFIRAKRSGESIAKANLNLDEQTTHDLHHNHLRHKIFSSVNGVTMAVSSVGAMMSATMWYGYCVLAPCCVASVGLNWYWRHRLGYGRPSFYNWVGTEEQAFDILPRIKANIAAKAYLKGNLSLREGIDRTDDAAGEKRKSDVPLLGFMTELDLQQMFVTRLERAVPALSEDFEPISGQISRPASSLEEVITTEEGLAIRTAGQIITETGICQFRDRERFLLELFGYWLCDADPEKRASVAENA